MQITENFKLEDFTTTSYADLLSQNLEEAQEYLTSIATCASRAEDIWKLFGSRVYIHSGFRCKALNDRVGSSDRSQHRIGEAFDFHIAGFVETPDRLRSALGVIVKSDIPYHQLLIERGCLHLGLYQAGRPNWEVAWWDAGKKVVYAQPMIKSDGDLSPPTTT